MAVRAYQTTRGEENLFPIPEGWTEFFHVPNATTPTSSGFEAVPFQRGNEIVISFAGTDSSDFLGDMVADAALGAGLVSTQLFKAAQYYFQVKAANPDAKITLTGHSLGGEYPDGWDLLNWTPDGWTGFSVGAFINYAHNQIVISYTGTNDKIADRLNWTAGMGLPVPQIFLAASYYVEGNDIHYYRLGDGNDTIDTTGNRIIVREDAAVDGYESASERRLAA